MARKRFSYWNRKVHIYLGLYFLLFAWLFSISGLALNHSDWAFIKSEPVDENSEVAIRTPAADDDFARAQDVMRQLGITGEVHQMNASKQEPYDLGFTVIRPQYFTFIQVDFDDGQADVRVRHRGFWAGLSTMHTFASMSIHREGMFRDWLVTKVWSVSTDALAIGVIVILFAGIVMWWQLKPKRRVGLICIGAGCVSCAFFVVGLRVLFT